MILVAEKSSQNDLVNSAELGGSDGKEKQLLHAEMENRTVQASAHVVQPTVALTYQLCTLQTAQRFSYASNQYCVYFTLGIPEASIRRAKKSIQRGRQWTAQLAAGGAIVLSMENATMR